MCNSKSKASYFQCARHVWTEMTCVAGTVCRVVRNNAVCVDPNTAVQVSDSDRDVQIACPTNNMTMCDGSDRSSFYTCTNNKWAKMKCDHNTVCIVRHDKALCADQATANAPVQPCTVAKSTRCVPDNRRVFQVCSDGFWANSTCAGSDFCLFRANAAMCVDKATADAPVLPCKQPNATRCVDGSAVAYQVCSDGYWTNATCNRGSVCGMKQGAALCHDPKQPIIDVPDQPCSNDGTMQCPEDNASRYQVCTDGLWANFTCDGTNVCRMSGDRAVCGDRDGADAPLSMVTLHAPTGYRANVSLGTSTHALCAWSITALLGVTALALGAGV
ncbi:hypothetical protein LPJ61_000049 [Coemansia biformis]|uniref:Uncharacterized protein n=1 Tax=Coemansia biformis TaxID=1286918 RepID=A0A9W8D1E1_9FUNG|nr:hypothetical protein LPJ61_000049 [Coemansia biformis]